MSENKTKCPNCYRVSNKKTARLKVKANRAYGKVAADEYVELRNKAESRVYLNDTLRQEYDVRLYVDAANLVINFECSCSLCGFVFEYRKEINVLE